MSPGTVEMTAKGLDGRSVVLMLPAAGIEDIIEPLRAAAASPARTLASAVLPPALRKSARAEAEAFPPRSGSFRVLMHAEEPLLFLSVCDRDGRWAEIPLDPESTRLLIGHLSTGLLRTEPGSPPQ
ncbi:hypothetical protein AE618_12330 [Bosea vaviloviae]|uniref:Uncharacterized protein n=2 Tax=Bosea vaviloviae TaxID=1526658 RepID=A0A0N1F4Z7_9HYPH|nr:hypothetical protein AE618_12330 [Bosea vaviloviae]